MSDRLYNFYEDELAFIREEVLQFGGRFSKVARRLKLEDTSEDPHVARLIESFALLNARMRMKIEDGFPEICHTLLQGLYPQYLAPIPSMAICRMDLEMVSADLATGLLVPKGAEVETEEVFDQPCKYRTCAPVRLYPIRVAECRYLKPPLPFKIGEDQEWRDLCDAAIELKIAPLSNQVPCSQMMIDNLRLFLGGLAANRLMEAMMRDCLAIGVYSDKCPDGVFLPPGCLEQVGFDPGEGLLDADPRTLPAYRLLWEFFALPDKFRLLQLNLQDAWSRAAGSECSIVFYFSRQHPQIQRQIAIESVQLGCVPVINLFEHSAEPISVDEAQYRYRVIPTHRAPHSMEIHSIVSVEATRTAGDKKIEYLPFHRPQHPQDLGDPQRFWHATRIFKPTENEGADSGSEIELAIVDLQGRPSPKDQWTLHVQTQCCNRDLVNHLSVSSRLRCTSGAIRTTFSTSPTPTRRPVSDDQWHWRLISHLSVNLLSLAEDRNAELLKETLSLYLSEDERDAKEIRYKAIDAIQSVAYQRDTARMLNPHGGQGVCRGIRIVLEVDEERLEVLGTYLICSILDRFFALFATINSWTQLTVLSKGSGGREVYRGPRRTGLREML